MNSLTKRILLVLVIMLFITISVSASTDLFYPEEYYNQTAWTWEYYDTYSPSYNCLAYVFGVTNMWIWPWGGENPTSLEVTLYMNRQGYQFYEGPYLPKIVSYGTATEIDHFAKIINGTTTRSKWGPLEVMTSYSWDPYTGCREGYGNRMLTYK